LTTPVGYARRPRHTALLLPGGGCRTAFQAGALEALQEAGRRFDHVTGVSAGALNGTAWVLEKTNVLGDVWRGLAGSRLLSLRNLGFNFSPFNMSWIAADVLNAHASPEAIASARTEFAVVTTRVRDRSRQVFSNRDAVDMVRAIRASIFLPPLYSRPVFLNGALHVDGGFTDNAPIDVPLDAGHASVLAITADHEGRLQRRPFGRRARHRAEHHDAVEVIHPREPLGIGMFDFNLERIERAMKLGREAALRALHDGRV
jgi:predicted acylesterase/phospholipase RssA